MLVQCISVSLFGHLLDTYSCSYVMFLLLSVFKEDGESNGMPLGAEEEVGSSQPASAQTQTLVLMDPDGNTGNLIYDEATGIITEQVHHASFSLNSFLRD